MYILTYNGFPMEELGTFKSYAAAKIEADKHDLRLAIERINMEDLLKALSKTEEIKHYLNLSKFAIDNMVNKNDILRILGVY